MWGFFFCVLCGLESNEAKKNEKSCHWSLGEVGGLTFLRVVDIQKGLPCCKCSVTQLCFCLIGQGTRNNTLSVHLPTIPDTYVFPKFYRFMSKSGNWAMSSADHSADIECVGDGTLGVEPSHATHFMCLMTLNPCHIIKNLSLLLGNK